MACSRREGCDLPEVIKSRVALLLWQREFCEDASQYEQCVRFQIAAGGQQIPSGMLPNGYRLGQTVPAT